MRECLNHATNWLKLSSTMKLTLSMQARLKIATSWEELYSFIRWNQLIKQHFQTFKGFAFMAKFHPFVHKSKMFISTSANFSSTHASTNNFDEALSAQVFFQQLSYSFTHEAKYVSWLLCKGNCSMQITITSSKASPRRIT